eukprot:9517860-Prorocentrum_lima.AAC.1
MFITTRLDHLTTQQITQMQEYNIKSRYNIYKNNRRDNIRKTLHATDAYNNAKEIWQHAQICNMDVQ